VLADLDGAMIQEHLAQAEEHVALGEHHLARQREIIAQLERDSQDTRDALELLAQFEKLYTQHLTERDRLRAELAAKAE
jgi:hypothetical protein